ncbi:hypothetical protein [Halorussus amylolyticus]|uniref:hypothetical protein n=1 Tax=Halorussus amylolyticus TaxID=1126242 RepID=UPI00104E3333|nr:hypothetical protein [Halorussus amylolyticus]
MRAARLLAHWRTWLNLGTVAFSASVFTVLLGDSIPRTLLGYSTSRVARYVVQFGFLAAIVCFFAGFACLAWRQATESE